MDVQYYTTSTALFPAKRFAKLSSFRGSQKIGEKGGVERKLSLGLVRSFFALSIGDNYLLFSLSTLGSYHWLRTRRLLRLQKANSSLAPLPLRFAAKMRSPVALQAAVGRGVPPRRPKNENRVRNILVQCLSVWVFESELELVNVANVKISSSNVAEFPIGNWYWLWQHFHTGNIYKCWSWRVGFLETTRTSGRRGAPTLTRRDGVKSGID